jgi:hypothetical protein
MTSIGFEFGYPVVKLEGYIRNFLISTIVALVVYTISMLVLRRPMFAGVITCFLGCIVSAYGDFKKDKFKDFFPVMETSMDLILWFVISIFAAGFFSNLHWFPPIREIDFWKTFAFFMSFGGAAMMNGGRAERSDKSKEDAREMVLWKFLSYSLIFGVSEVAHKYPAKVNHGSTRDTSDILLQLLIFQLFMMFFVIRTLDGIF